MRACPIRRKTLRAKPKAATVFPGSDCHRRTCAKKVFFPFPAPGPRLWRQQRSRTRARDDSFVMLGAGDRRHAQSAKRPVTHVRSEHLLALLSIRKQTMEFATPRTCACARLSYSLVANFEQDFKAGARCPAANVLRCSCQHEASALKNSSYTSPLRRFRLPGNQDRDL
jgi:hypothetical protein